MMTRPLFLMLTFALCFYACQPRQTGYQETKDKVRVACIGNSITYGYTIRDRKKHCYPAQLQRLLGDAYYVGNFGVSGSTLLNSGDLPYTAQKAYQDALALQPHIVIIKLGSNDMKDINWRYSKEYEANYLSLIQSFRDLESKPKIWLCTPTPIYTNEWEVNNQRLANKLIPKIEQVATEAQLPIIPLYEALQGYPQYFPDAIHPNKEGAKIIAKTVFRQVFQKGKSAP